MRGCASYTGCSPSAIGLNGLFKFETVVPEAFRVMAALTAGRPLDDERIVDPVAAVRRRCRDAFRRTDLLSQLIPAIEDLRAAGWLNSAGGSGGSSANCYSEPRQFGDAGHRG